MPSVTDIEGNRSIVDAARATVWICALLRLCTIDAAAQIADVHQGTNITVALSPERESLAVDLMGGLWTLPVGGGGAQALVPAGQGIRNPRFHPDGHSIVVQRWVTGQWDLWLYELDTGGWRALTNTSYNEREPEFSIDGHAVLFSADATGRYCLWEMNLADGSLRQLTDEPGDSSFPSVSDRGDVAYVNHDRGAATLLLYSGSLSGSEVYRSTDRLSAPSWRPGGRVIVFNELDGSRESTLKMLLLVDDPVTKNLTQAEDVFLGRVAWLSSGEVIYSADGQIWRRGVGERTRSPIHLFAGVGVAGATEQRVAPALDAAGPHPVTGIVGAQRSRGKDAVTFAALGDLWLSVRGEAERLTDDPFVDTYPTPSPDGESLVFVSDRGGNMDLWMLRFDGRVITQLTGEAAKPFAPVIDSSGRQVAYLETEGLGRWEAASLKLLDIARPYKAETIASGLYDARNLKWEPGSGSTQLRLEARRESPNGALLEWTFPSNGDPPVQALVRAVKPEETSDDIETAGIEWNPQKAAEPYVVQVGRVFDGVRNDYLRHMDIHVEGQRIMAIVRRGSQPLPARVIDLSDATVIPGFIDVHTHQSALVGERLGRMWLINGVTTVREISDELPEALERAESWASGRRPGPRLVISPTSAAYGFGDADLPWVRGYAQISPGFGHDVNIQRDQLGLPPLARPPPHAVVARSADTATGWLRSSALNISYQDTLAAILASGATVSTGLGAVFGGPPETRSGRTRAAEAFADLFSPREQRGWQPPVGQTPIAPLQDTIGRVVRNGGRVAVGSDAPAVPYGFGIHSELALLAAAGIPNDQVLRLASAGGATALGLEQQLGTLEAGKLADFIVLAGDPLKQLDDAATMIAVVKGGHWFTREELLARPKR
jgi:Tol biopolymer transport system component